MSASGTIYLTISALIYTVIIIILFLTKKKVNKSENRIFNKLLWLSVLSMITELLIVFTKDVSYLGTFIQKLFLVFVLMWLSRFMDYTFAITVFDNKKSDDENAKKYKKLYYAFWFVNVLCAIAIMLAPIYFNDIGDAKYTSGPSVNIVFAITGIYMIAMFVLLITHLKNIRNKRCLPIIALLVLLTTAAIFQNINPQILLTNAVFGLVICLMYNTIENPDLKLIAQLELAKEHAEKANRAKTDFLSSMSHEIRTPLNAVIGSAQLLEMEELSDDGKDALKDLMTASNSLLEMGSGILNISQIESGMMDLAEREYSPVDSFNELYDLLKGRIAEKPIEFNKIYAEDLPETLFGDIGKIKEITTNLLTNAIKYTEKGKIDFIVKSVNHKDECDLIISVSDTGRGISNETKDKIFQKFTRADDVMDSTIEGVGLGLSITKNLVEIMGGTITVNSIVDRGSVFTVKVTQKIVKKDNNISENNSVENTENMVNVSNEILIVDDNNMNLKIEQRHLEYFGLKVDICYSGHECLEKVKSGKKYSVILMDDMMPELTGTETMQILKNELSYDKPIIVLTANATDTERDRYLASGFDEFVSKPISKDDLYKVVKKYL